jgi:GTP pyrophosphokinase
MSTVSTATLLGLFLTHAPAARAEGADPPVSVDAPSADQFSLAMLEADARSMLGELGIEGTLSSRVKAPDSLTAKALRKGIAEDDVLDRLALRVRVDGEGDCYTVMDGLCDRYHLIDGSHDDYIAQPKANGYQSLHAAFQTPVGPVEFQVRTHEMHHHAEWGDASHLEYKRMQAQAS